MIYKEGTRVEFKLGINRLMGVVNERVNQDDDLIWMYETSTGERVQVHVKDIIGII